MLRTGRHIAHYYYSCWEQIREMPWYKQKTAMLIARYSVRGVYLLFCMNI